MEILHNNCFMVWYTAEGGVHDVTQEYLLNSATKEWFDLYVQNAVSF